jgi:filamentous hemagglutinin family protein
MQAAARSAAAALNNLGADPNHPGHQLPDVPNGLVTGGLVPDSGLAASGLANAVTTWQNAKTPVQSPTDSNGRTKVTIQQTGQQAILNWQTFNIGKDTTLNFDQSAGGANVGQWIAFNKVNDPSGVPSQILGSMTGQGQVYVINTNGIIFGGASQINLHTLVASSLPINDNLINRGLLNNPDSQFLFSSLAIPAGSNGTPAFTPTDHPYTSHDGDVTVQAGAEISAPTTADHVGGRVALIGPNVTNAGTISTPDGQTILAAGLQVGMVAHNSADPSLRGLDTYVGYVDPLFSGVATNSGLINTPRADAWLTGMTVNQNGAINSTTSVSLNGRIDLLADYGAVSNLASNTVGNAQSGGGVLNLTPYTFLPRFAGLVTLGEGSVTQILPEWSSNEQVVGTQLSLTSQVNLQGNVIHFCSNSDLFAPNANISMDAGQWVYSPGSNQYSAFIYDGGQIYLDAGAAINAAGSTDVAASVSEFIVTAKLLGPELANSPLQRTGVLRGQSVQFDARQTGVYNGKTWVGTPVADVSGYVNLIQRGVGELTTAGGTVKLNAGGSVVLKNGASIDVSGGWTNFQGATVQTTQVSANGHVYDISQASPDRVYTGIVSSVSHYENGYLQGGNGGGISISAPAMALDGKLYGNTVAGGRQRVNGQRSITVSSGTVVPNFSALPVAGTLSLSFEQQSASSFLYYLMTPPTITIGPEATPVEADVFGVDPTEKYALHADRTANVFLSPDLVNVDGFGNLKIDNSDDNVGQSGNLAGKIVLASGVTLSGPAGGSLTFLSGNIDIEGKITIPSGSLSFSAMDTSPSFYNYLQSIFGASTPPVNPARGNFMLGSGALINTAGLIVDDRQTSAAPGSLPLALDGGSVFIGGYNVKLLAGSAVDVSGGVSDSATSKLSYGKGGAISILSGRDLNISSVTGGSLEFGAELSGYSGSLGGSLSLLAPLIQIGGQTSNKLALQLQPDFFSRGGFSSFSLTGLGDPSSQSTPAVLVTPGTKIKPVVTNWQAGFVAGSGALNLSTALLPEGLRVPVSLSFNAAGITDNFNAAQIVRGDLVMGLGSIIEIDPTGNVAINGVTTSVPGTVSLAGNTVAVLGSIIAPGGSINVTGGINSIKVFPAFQSQALPTVDIGPSAVLSTAGMEVLVPDATGNNLRVGSVLSGGNITLKGNIVSESGAVLDVSGATGKLDLAASYSLVNSPLYGAGSFFPYISTRVDSNGGTITLQGAQELFVDSTLSGAAGGPGATGGTLSISGGRFYAAGSQPASPLDVSLLVTQHGPTFKTDYYPSGETAIGNAVLDSQSQPLVGIGYFAADSFNNHGFDNLIIKKTPEFSGPVNLTANGSLQIADSGVIFADPNVATSIHLTAPYVKIGQAFQAPLPEQQVYIPYTQGGAAISPSPTYGVGTLLVNATQLIDIGYLTLQNIGSASFSALGGDIRGDGTLDIQGKLTLTAGQIYPPTESTFNIFAYDKASQSVTGSVTIALSGDRKIPLSAGGQLNIFASDIMQGGVLRAPMGSIILGWNGTGSAPTDPISGNSLATPKTIQLTLLPGSITSVSAVDPVTGQSLTIPYGTNLNGSSWIDPSGTDITSGGVPAKSITISAQGIDSQAGSVVDIRGGGDLYAYRWVSGLGGSTDILASTSSFAVIPGYQAAYAPYAPFNNATPGANNQPFFLDQGYVNSSLSIGTQVYLAAGSGLPAGVYTLLPARYALLPGAFLVTPKTILPSGNAVQQADGATMVSGYVFNGMNAAQTAHPLASTFEVASQTVLLKRAEYDSFSGNTFLKQGALSNNASVPRLPVDSGYLVLEATQAMSIAGSLDSKAVSGGLGGLVDISSPEDILIAGPSALTSGFSGLVLQSAGLSAFGADSLLIGGVRSLGSGGETIAVTTNNITVDNAGAPLMGPDIILAATQTLTLGTGAEVEQSGAANGIAGTLLIGNAASGGSGDGALLRVSSNAAAQLIRSGVDSSALPSMSIGAGALVSGVSVTLDSTHATILDPTATLGGQSINLGSGQISLQLSNPGSLLPTSGLVLSSGALQTLQSAATSLSFLSYSSLDLYGSGQIGAPAFSSLALHAAEIRGFNNGGGTVTFDAKSITIDNSPGNSGPGPVAAPAGTLTFNANTIQLGANQLAIDQFSNVEMNAVGGILARNTGGLTVQGDLGIDTPLITGATAASQTISAGGALTIHAPAQTTATVAGGLGASLTLIGDGITENGKIVLPSGNLTLHSTGGDLQIGNVAASRLDVSGQTQSFFDVVKYTSGGQINLIADAGNVNIAAGSTVTVAAPSGGGNAGSLTVSAPSGIFVASGSILGNSGAGGIGGSFSLDAGALNQPGATQSTANLDAALNTGGFTLSRSIRVRAGDVMVDGVAKSETYNLSADNGGITVASTGEINASGVTGGSIDFAASGNVTLEDGAVMTVAAQKADNAGEAGIVTLETTGGRITINTGSIIDLSLAGAAGGTLHLRAPQVDANNKAISTNSAATPVDVAVDPFGTGSIVNPGSIVVEGFYVQNANSSSTVSIDGWENSALSNANAFMSNASAIQARLTGGNAGMNAVFNLSPGEEIDNSKGGLVLNNNWDLSTWRFGPQKITRDINGNPISVGVDAGILTLRALGSITFNGSLSDGFGDGRGYWDLPADAYGSPALWLANLLPGFSDGTPQRSWSYHITSGADFGAANLRQVLPVNSLSAGTGSVRIGKNAGSNTSPGGANAISDTLLENYYQVIRTGAGSIDISAGRSVQFLNQFSTVYTAGAQVADPTMGGAFDLPQTDTGLGLYMPQYSQGGGNVNITAQVNIEHITKNNNGVEVADSQHQLPMSWLYRRGYVDASGRFGLTVALGDVASTSWWVDFSNFFEGVGALGGGNVTMSAGNNVSNVDAVVPTNARMPGRDSLGHRIPPNASSLVELGGGDVTVTAGNNIDGGVYYVERGNGKLSAGNSIKTNSARTPSLSLVINSASPYSSQSWLPTTLFLGKGNFDVRAKNDLLLGPVANPFLLPVGVNNSFIYKTYFSTYASSDTVRVGSLTGNVTLRENTTLPDGTVMPLLQAWLQNVMLLPVRADSGLVSYYQPWVRLAETSVAPFATVASLMPSSLLVTAFSGDVNLVGPLTLAPSPSGTVDILADGSLNGLQINGVANHNNNWTSTTINLSDANPASIPGIDSPFASQTITGGSINSSMITPGKLLAFIDALFKETGATNGAASVLQAKQTLHGSNSNGGPLHAGDPNKVHLYASNGDISGIKLFAGKSAQIVAGSDITDIAFYVQNSNAGDLTVVSAGRDIIAYDPTSPLRTAALSLGNAGGATLAGDIQINGPGTLEVLAGRNLDLGIGPTNSDGTAFGITSIGNARNPYLPSAGANIIASAGISDPYNLGSSTLQFSAFITKFLDPSTVGGLSPRYLSDLSELLGLSGQSDQEVWTAYKKLGTEQQDMLALDIFYLVLRDAGRDHNDPTSAGYKNYKNGYGAIATLFPGTSWQGNISLTSREIKTASGGDISLFAPGGQLTVGLQVANQPADQGILTQAGGNINIFTNGNVTVGTSRIFTLRGGNEIIWSTHGNIAAGSASKTVQSAPPTRVLVDPQSGNVTTDLAGLATGGGIGVLATVAGVALSDIDLIAPTGVIDAGDAGIRVSGNLNISAQVVLNAGNIQVGGASTGAPSMSVSAPSMGGLASNANAQANSSNSGDQAAKQNRGEGGGQDQIPSIISVEVLGYGGGDGDDEEELKRKKKQNQEAPVNTAEEQKITKPGLASAF